MELDVWRNVFLCVDIFRELFCLPVDVCLMVLTLLERLPIEMYNARLSVSDDHRNYTTPIPWDISLKGCGILKIGNLKFSNRFHDCEANCRRQQ